MAQFVILRTLRALVRLRYLVIGTTVVGGVKMSQKFEEWKSSLPDFKWMDDVFPKDDRFDQMRLELVKMKEKFAPESGFMRNVSNTLNGKVDVFRQWLEEAREAKNRERKFQMFIFSANLRNFRIYCVIFV